MGKKFDTAQSIIEYLIAAVFILGGVSLLFAEPINSVSPVLNFLGSYAASVIYFFLYTFTGIFLIQAKIRKKRKQHKYGLMAIYLAAIFTFCLEYALLGGWSWYLMDAVVIFLLAGGFWLRFKIRTEYFSPSDIARHRDQARKLRH